MTNAITATISAPVASNVSTFGKDILSILDAKDKSDTGSFALINKHRVDLERLMSKIDDARDADDSVRAVILDFFRATDEGEKVYKRYNDLVAMKNNTSADQRAQKELLKKRIHNVNMMLTRTVDILSVILDLENEEFRITFKTMPNTGATVCKIMGGADDEPAMFSAAQLLRIVGNNFTGLTSYDALQEQAKSSKAGTPNKDKAPRDAIAPSKIADTVDALDDSVARYDIGVKDSGLSQGSVIKLALLWARLDAALTPSQKLNAKTQFDAEGSVVVTAKRENVAA